MEVDGGGAVQTAQLWYRCLHGQPDVWVLKQCVEHRAIRLPVLGHIGEGAGELAPWSSKQQGVQAHQTREMAELLHV